VFFAQGIHILVMQWPFMQRVLGVAPVTLGVWLSLFSLAGLLLVVMEVFKAVQNRLKQRTLSPKESFKHHVK